MVRAIVLALVVLVAGGLTEPIPMAVLAGIAVYVGLNILDWSFIQRAHKVSIQGMVIMYGGNVTHGICRFNRCRWARRIHF